MLLVDKDIKVFLNNGKLPDQNNQTAIFQGNEEQVTNIGYDLVCNAIYKSADKGEDVCALLPGESAFVESREYIHFDNSTVGIVALKNSRIRMGLSLSAPVYQPGHSTPILFRLTNITNKEITLCAGEKYAMISFYQLSHEPETPYNGTFQKETAFRGMGEYSSVYAEQIKEIDNKVNDLKTIERTLYGNVITILTIFIGIFTLLNVNITLARETSSITDFIAFNLAIIGSISFLSILLDEFLHKKEAHHWLWILPVVCFLVLIVVMLIA